MGTAKAAGHKCAVLYLFRLDPATPLGTADCAMAVPDVKMMNQICLLLGTRFILIPS
jgi:hypothetical protein